MMERIIINDKRALSVEIISELTVSSGNIWFGHRKNLDFFSVSSDRGLSPDIRPTYADKARMGPGDLALSVPGLTRQRSSLSASSFSSCNSNSSYNNNNIRSNNYANEHVESKVTSLILSVWFNGGCMDSFIHT